MSHALPSSPALSPALPGAASPLERVRARIGRLTVVQRIGIAVLALKLAGFMIWSALLYHRFALTPDFAQYQQAWYLIGHGSLNPYDTVGNFAFWQNHGEFIMWPLALLSTFGLPGVTLLFVQDACVVGAELVAFWWLCDLVPRYCGGRSGTAITLAGLVLLAVNPWSWWSVSFDFHAECLAVLFIALLARDLMNERRRAWLWIPLLIACGDVAGTYIFGLGLGAALVRGQRMRGLAVAGCGILAVLGISAIHGNLGSGHGLQAYDYLAAPGRTAGLSMTGLMIGLATHPVAVAAKLWSKQVDIWANLAPSGLVGLAFLPLLPIMMVILVSNDLFRGFLFSEPLFQSLPIYVLLPVGSAAVLARVARRWRKTALVLTVIIVVQAIGWSAVWSPRTVGQWDRVPARTAATLSAVLSKIPGRDAVFASQGVVGRFSERRDVRPMNGHLPIQAGTDWFVFVPWAGIETQKPAAAMVFAGQLAGPMHAKLMLDRNGVWVFRWHPPAGVHRLTVPGGSAPLPAWTAPSVAGRSVRAGPASSWHVTSTGREGYIAARLEWARDTGLFTARVTLSSKVPVNVEVWDNTGKTLLNRISLPSTSGRQTLTIPVNAGTSYYKPLYGGWGPFRALFGGGPKGERIEVRVWTAEGAPGAVSIYSAQLSPRASPGAS